MKKLTTLLSFLLALQIFTYGQDCKLRISVLTCAPGSELYSTFGHTAVRVIDSARGTDIVFNWGTFDFNDPSFYTKFVRGKLDYFLSMETPDEFLSTYQYEQRSVVEQELNLSCQQKSSLYHAIQTNLLPQNRYYKYDFLKDNCTSRVRDLLKKHAGFTTSQNIVDDNTTYRNMLHQYLDGGGKPWSKLGIDILLGSELDKQANDHTAMFLPDYLMKGIDSSHTAGGSIVASRNILYQATEEQEKGWNHAPLVVLSVFSAVVILFSFSKKRSAQRLLRVYDAALFVITGLLGFLVLFMWVGTEHTVCQKNFNLLWALPTHLFAAFLLNRRSKIARYYFLAAAILHAATLLLWAVIPQEINIALFPFVLLLAVRCYQHYKKHR